MEPLISPKVTVGVHCVELRTKSMYINALVDPAERTFYEYVTEVTPLIEGLGLTLPDVAFDRHFR